MAYVDAFTILQSEAFTVRVELTDMIIVEGRAIGGMRFTVAQVRHCSPMLVSGYRDHFDRAFVAPDDGEIVVRLHVEGVFEGVLGPFPHRDGMGLADAIHTACSHLLFAAPGFSVRVAPDSARVVVDCVANGMRMTIPIPAAGLVGCEVRPDARIDARYALPSGLAPHGEPAWVVFEFAQDKPYLLGPLAMRDAHTLVRAFRAWRASVPLDAEPVDVTWDDLVAGPTRWHLRRIRVTGEWQYMFESSAFAHAWLRPPEGFRAAYGTHRVRVVGTWIHPGGADARGYGHLGMWPGDFEAESIELFDE